MNPPIVIKCPDCKLPVDFYFAAFKSVPNKDIEYFKNSKNFTVVEKLPGHGGYYNVAFFYHGLRDNLQNISDLPEGYWPEMWNRNYWFSCRVKGFENSGSYRCAECATQRKYNLSWPNDAYYQINYRGNVLWAYDRHTAVRLFDYIRSHTRLKSPENSIVQDWFLRKIPEHFQSAKARDEITKKLGKLLGV